ncbi:hypothetical protein [Paenibacillus ginsengarvi]|uniref:hypothetical protein n=1 Tax=Paenibacillus ginsengarvi TaxID=400777 RepID=UPI0013159F27|nr:hypothetical protein [Paenibacillus ginsengarvi]
MTSSKLAGGKAKYSGADFPLFARPCGILTDNGTRFPLSPPKYADFCGIRRLFPK